MTGFFEGFLLAPSLVKNCWASEHRSLFRPDGYSGSLMATGPARAVGFISAEARLLDWICKDLKLEKRVQIHRHYNCESKAC